jgi:hypothetical protein
MITFVHILCYHLLYHLCYHMMLSFFTVSKCHHFYVIIFPLYIFCVIIYVIIWCYHLLLSFPPFFLFPENVTHSKQILYLESTSCYKKNLDLFLSMKLAPPTPLAIWYTIRMATSLLSLSLSPPLSLSLSLSLLFFLLSVWYEKGDFLDF